MIDGGSGWNIDESCDNDESLTGLLNLLPSADFIRGVTQPRFFFFGGRFPRPKNIREAFG